MKCNNNSNNTLISDKNNMINNNKKEIFNNIQENNKNNITIRTLTTLIKLLQIKKNTSPELTKRSISALIMITIVIFGLIQKNFFFTALILILVDQAMNEARCAIANSYNPNTKPHFLKSYTCWRFLIVGTFISIVFIRHSANGIVNLLWLLITTSSIDTAAYFIGKNFGNKKILPNISPNKTYAGLIAGWIAALLVGLFFYGLKNNIGIIKICSIQTTLLILAQFGDFYESAFKRLSEIKDTSKLLPGHGGILDRIDSLIFTSMFMAIMILLKII